MLIWGKNKKDHFEYVEFASLQNVENDLKDSRAVGANRRFTVTKSPTPTGDDEWHATGNPAARIILQLPKKWATLKSCAERVFQGIITGGDKLFLFELKKQGLTSSLIYSRQFEKDFEIENALMRPFFRGANIKPYELQQPDYLILFPYKLVEDKTVFYSEEEIAQMFPLAWGYLKFAKTQMASRGSERMNYPIWYALWNARDIRLLTSPKILVPTIANRPAFAFDPTGGCFFLGSGAGGPGAYGLTLPESEHSPYYFLALLNSRITAVYIDATSSVFRGGYRAYSQQFLWGIPFRPINFQIGKERIAHDRLVKFAQNMVAMHTLLTAAKTPHEQKSLATQIAATDRQIDLLVYALYGLTPDEIKIVEQDRNEPASLAAADEVTMVEEETGA